MPKHPSAPAVIPAVPISARRGFTAKITEKNGAMTAFAAAQRPEVMTHIGEKRGRRSLPASAVRRMPEKRCADARDSS